MRTKPMLFGSAYDEQDIIKACKLSDCGYGAAEKDIIIKTECIPLMKEDKVDCIYCVQTLIEMGVSGDELPEGA